MAPKKKAKAAPKEEPKAAAAAAKEEPKAKAAAAAPKEEPKAPPKAAPAVKKEEPAAKAAAPEKRKAEEKPEEPAKKEPKTADVDVSEKEKDAPADKRPTLKESVSFCPYDSTLNVIPTMEGQVLMSLSDGGMQYLIAGARGNVGMKAGRYMFEVKIIEALNPTESSANAGRGRAPAPRQLLRIGFSTAGSPLILGDSEDHICFDSEGAFHASKKKTPAAQRFTRDQIIAVVLNLDPKSPNHNTMSLFREGERIAEPQKLPENLHGKTLFPHVSFRNVSVQVLFGQQPAKPLPFKCRQLGAAAQADVVPAPKPAPKGGKYEVMLPVAFPDEGTFEWLDGFLAKNPHYVELSDRKILDWAASSGLWKPKATNWSKNSNDKPEFNYGLPAMDDFSIQRLISTMASVVPRDYVIMEVKSNLLKDDRQKVLERFNAPHFKKVAHVVMGEPDDEFKQMALDKLLKEKQAKADMAWRAKKAEEKRKKEMEEKQKKLAEMRKKADEARKKAAEEAKKKAEEAKKKAEAAKKKAEAEKKKAEAKKKAEEAGEEYVEEEEPEEEEVKEEKMEVDEEAKEETKEEAKEEEKEDVKMEEEEEETEPPKVELTEEEQKMWFRPAAAGACTDLTSAALTQSFGGFSIPEKSEGFDEIRFAWQGDAASKEYLKKWVLEKKRSSRIDDLQPGQMFQDKIKEWTKLFAEWQAKQKAFKNSAAQKEKEAAAKKKAEEKKKKEEAKEKEGEGEEEEEEEEETPPVDVMMVDDVNDVGNGEPLFKDFAFEDWALLQLRYELYLLTVAFKKDVNDPDRPGVGENHFAFYYNRYFRKTLTPAHFKVTTVAEIPGLVKDTVSWDSDEKVLTTSLEEEMESVTIFVKFAEENRRERQRRIDAGDETARLKFSPLAIQQPSPKPLGTPVAGGAKAWPAAGAAKAWQGNPAAKAWPQQGFRPAGAGAWGAQGGQWGGKGRW